MNTPNMTVENDNTADNDNKHCNQQLPQNWIELDQRYRKLATLQDNLEGWLRDLKNEEQALQKALDQAVSASQPPKLGKPSQKEAIDRLAQALFDDDDDDTDESG
jgi:hypothetical protein